MELLQVASLRRGRRDAIQYSLVRVVGNPWYTARQRDLTAMRHRDARARNTRGRPHGADTAAIAKGTQLL
jgi:hypothetical protein